MKRKAIPTQLKDRLLVLCKHACMICRSPYTVSHHIEPISEGGGNEWMNLIVLCPNCHHRVHITKEIKESQLQIYRQNAEEGKLDPPTNKAKIIPFPKRPLIDARSQKAENITNIAAQHIGNIKVVTKGKPSVKLALSPDYIGGDPFLVMTIEDRVKKLADYRIKRLQKENPYKDPKEISKQVYSVIWRSFKSRFSIRKQPYTVFKKWHKAAAKDILDYFDDLIDETIQGKIEKAARSPNYKHSRRQLFKQEVQLLKYFGLSTNSPEVDERLYMLFRVISHKNLTDYQHWQWVKYLESKLDELKANPNATF